MSKQRDGSAGYSLGDLLLDALKKGQSDEKAIAAETGRGRGDGRSGDSRRPDIRRVDARAAQLREFIRQRRERGGETKLEQDSTARADTRSVQGTTAPRQAPQRRREPERGAKACQENQCQGSFEQAVVLTHPTTTTDNAGVEELLTELERLCTIRNPEHEYRVLVAQLRKLRHLQVWTDFDGAVYQLQKRGSFLTSLRSGDGVGVEGQKARHLVLLQGTPSSVTLTAAKECGLVVVT